MTIGGLEVGRLLAIRRLPVLGFVVVSILSTPNPSIAGSAFGNNPPISSRQSTITVDGLAAVVAGEPIFLSDVWNVERLQLMDPSGSLAALMAGRADDAERQVLERIIDRRLVLGEIARYAPIRPPQPEIDAAVARWRARADARGVEIPADDPIALAFIVDTLRIERYIEQRFTAAAHPTREEARAYYLANTGSFARGGVTPPFDDVEDNARARLGEERRLAMVRDWLEGLRARAQVRVVDRVRVVR